jgi:diacylglycerol kinase
MKETLRKRLVSFRYAAKGIASAVQSEPNIRLHLVAAIVVPIIGFWVKLSIEEWALVVLAIGLVWVSEMLNTAIERLVDLLHPDWHPLAGRVKDLAAGGVLIAAITSFIIGLLVFGRHFVVLLGK